jgi:hypothetical protein
VAALMYQVEVVARPQDHESKYDDWRSTAMQHVQTLQLCCLRYSAAPGIEGCLVSGHCDTDGTALGPQRVFFQVSCRIAHGWYECRNFEYINNVSNICVIKSH